MNFSEIQQHPKFLVSPDFTPPINGEHILNRTQSCLLNDLFFGLLRLIIPSFLYLAALGQSIMFCDEKFSFSTNFPISVVVVRIILAYIPMFIVGIIAIGLVGRIFFKSRKIYFFWDDHYNFYSNRCFLQTDDLGDGLTSRSPFEEFDQVEDITLIKESGEMEMLLKGYGGWIGKMRREETMTRVRVTPERRFNDKTNELYKYLKQIVDIRDELQNKKGL
jgi:hypothetical protein